MRGEGNVDKCVRIRGPDVQERMKDGCPEEYTVYSWDLDCNADKKQVDGLDG